MTTNLPIVTDGDTVVKSKLYKNSNILFSLDDSTDTLQRDRFNFDQSKISLAHLLSKVATSGDLPSIVVKNTEKLLSNNNTQINMADKNYVNMWGYQHQHQGVELKTPYYERNHLKTALSWLHHSSCQARQGIIVSSESKSTPRFRVRIYSSGCINELPPQEFYVEFCVANFENLQFECEYFVEVNVLKNRQVRAFIFFCYFFLII